nr:MAG TPA_asm: hypothetical protein [Bacteriophage sp.]
MVQIQSVFVSLNIYILKNQDLIILILFYFFFYI